MSWNVSKARRGRSFAYEGGEKNTLRMRRSLEFDVEYLGDNPQLVSEPAVMAAAGLPKVNYSTFEHGGRFVPYLLCKRKSAKQNPKVNRRWLVTCDYESDPKEGDEQDEEQELTEPMSITPKIATSTEVLPIAVYRDFNDKEYVTPARNKFEDAAHREDTITVLTITQYELGWTDAKARARNRRVNLAEYRGEDSYKWKIEDVAASPTEIYGFQVHQVTYTLKLHPGTNGWRDERVAVDTHYLVDKNGVMVKRPFLSLGQPTTGFINVGDPDDAAAPVRGTRRDPADGVAIDTFEFLEKLEFNDFLPPAAA